MVRDIAPNLPKLSGAIEGINSRMGTLEAALGDIMSKADKVLKDNTQEMDRVKVTVEKELITLSEQIQENSVKHESLIGHAQAKFGDLEVKLSEGIEIAGAKFQQLEALRQDFEGKVAQHVMSLESKMKELGNLQGMAQNSVYTVGQNQSPWGPSEYNNKQRVISEFKAIS